MTLIRYRMNEHAGVKLRRAKALPERTSMSTLIRDMSQIGPAPTLRRETAVLAVTTVVVLVVFGTLIAATDRPPFLYGAIGAALFAFGVIRWIVAAVRGDVTE
ncbi:MAG: hypothetical protein CSA58_06730 [Micrococcales bacterium]|nr:MAG: hypothetical protein CSA58_06730 [Micrococcales bacterium]